MKALNIIRSIFAWLMVALAVGMMIFTVISVSTFDRADRSLFGYKAFIVLSDSMSKTDFSAGDLVLVKEVDPSTLKEGDIIAYTSQNTSNYGETVTHKIRKLTTDANGEPGFVTYGTTTDTDDETVVTYPYVLGKYSSHTMRSISPKNSRFLVRACDNSSLRADRLCCLSISIVFRFLRLFPLCGIALILSLIRKSPCLRFSCVRRYRWCWASARRWWECSGKNIPAALRWR